MYKKEETEIFKYWNGERLVAIDPLTVSLKFQGISDQVNWQEVGVILSNEEARPDFDGLYSKVGAEVFLEFLGGLRRVFGIKEIEMDDDGNVTKGLSNVAVLKTYADFVRYCADVKKNTVDTPIFVQPTEQDGSMEDPVTSVSSDSHSTVSE